MDNTYKPKSFWRKPEGVTGAITIGGILIGGGWLIFSALPAIIAATSTMLGLAGIIMILGLIIYMALDSKARGLVWYMYKSMMRWITSLFVQIDPIGMLILKNKKEISSNLSLAKAAKKSDEKSQMILRSRKAGRLKESNIKYEALYSKMEILYRVLKKMYDNSEILKEDVADQVEIKEQELKAMKASHSAMSSAMNVIRGNKDKRAMFEMALEQVADDVSNKVGEMERFMEMSESFMGSIDLQNGIFEEEGLKMLEQWEQENSLILLDEKETLLLEGEEVETLDLNEKMVNKERVERANQYDSLFD